RHHHLTNYDLHHTQLPPLLANSRRAAHGKTLRFKPAFPARRGRGTRAPAVVADGGGHHQIKPADPARGRPRSGGLVPGQRPPSARRLKPGERRRSTKRRPKGAHISNPDHVGGKPHPTSEPPPRYSSRPYGR